MGSGNHKKIKSPSLALIIDFEETYNPLSTSNKNRPSIVAARQSLQPKAIDDGDVDPGADSEEEVDGKRIKAVPIDYDGDKGEGT